MSRLVIALFMSFILIIPLGCLSEKQLPKDTVFVGIQSVPATLDPRFAKDANGMRIGNLIFNSLVKIGPDLKVTGDAAKSWAWNGNSISFQLYPHLKFSNGRPLEKQDIEFTFNEYKKSENPFHSSLDFVKNVTVEGSNEGFLVTLHLKAFSAKLLTADLPMIRLLPAKEIQQDENSFHKMPIGTGSFALFKQEVNDIQLQAREDHPIQAPKVKNIVFKVVKNSFTLYQKIKKGELDIVQSELPLNKIHEFLEDKRHFQVFTFPGLSFSYLLINHNDPSLKHIEVRQALASAINRKEIIKYKLEGYASEATSLMTPGNPFHDSTLKNLDFDLQKAKALLKNKNIKLTLKTSNNQQAVEIGKILTQQLKQAGIEMEMKSFEWGTYFSDIQKGRFQLATMRWVGAIDPDLYRMAFHSRELPPGRNRGAYMNAQLDQLLDQGLKIKNTEERVKHYYKVQKMILKNLAVIPLWYNQQVSVVSHRIKDYRPSLNGDFSPLLQLDILEK